MKEESPTFTGKITIPNEWQLCPKCNGSGETKVTNYADTLFKCDLCNGKKIISKVTGEPPK